MNPFDYTEANEGFSVIQITEPAPRRQHGYKRSENPSAPHHTLLGVTTFPSEFRLPNFDKIPVRDQGNQPVCVAEALRTIREYLCLRGGIDVRLSMSFLYLGAKLRDNDPEPGTTPEAVLNVLEQLGTPHEATCPDAATAVLGVEEATAFTVQSAKLLDSLDAIREVLFEQQTPVLLGIELTADVEAAMDAGAALIPQPMADATLIGGHALVVYGWTTQHSELTLLVRNSWGLAWGDQGNGQISSTYPGLCNEAWAVYL